MNATIEWIEEMACGGGLIALAIAEWVARAAGLKTRPPYGDGATGDPKLDGE